MQSKDIARRLGVDASTVRRWARDYEPYLSPTAQKAEDDDQHHDEDVGERPGDARGRRGAG